MLREVAQTPDADLDAFQDVDPPPVLQHQHALVDLEALAGELDRRGGVLGLPLIRNRKTVDPADKSRPEVFQIETAMGAAIGVIEGARALRVSRARFTPVKTTNDLLALRSDAYEVAADGRVGARPDAPAAGRRSSTSTPSTTSSSRTSSRASPAGAPSLRECERLGGPRRRDVRRRRRGAPATWRSRAEGGPVHLADGTVLGGLTGQPRRAP